MPSAIRFERHYQESTFLSPLLGGAADTHRLELRHDPLLGGRSILSPRIADKLAMFVGANDAALLERYTRDTEARCFLCGDRWQKTTPLYPPELVPGGRIVAGEAVLFPNLFPVDGVHAVVRVSARHSLGLDELGAPLLADALGAAFAFARRLAAARPARHLTIAGNYLFPAGASIAHPHLQIVGGDVPCTWTARALAAGQAWRAAHGGCYWSELVAEEERLGERWAGRTGSVAWMPAFSPQGSNEIVGVLPERRSFAEVDDADIAGLAAGLAHVLAVYHELGLATYNLALFSGPLPGGDDSFRCQVRVISRQTVHENYRTDGYFLQRLLGDELILVTPEALAERLRRRMG